MKKKLLRNTLLLSLSAVCALAGFRTQATTESEPIPAAAATMSNLAPVQLSAPPVPKDSSPRLMVQSGHRGAVKALSYSKDGRLVVSGGEDRQLILWEAASGRVLARASFEWAVTSAEFSPDGSTIGVVAGNLFIWDTQTWTERGRISGSPEVIKAIEFSPDGRTILAVGTYAWGPGHDPEQSTAALWTVDAPRRLWSLESKTPIETDAVAVTRDGRYFALGSDLIRIVEAQTGRLAFTLQPLSPDGGGTLLEFKGVRALAFSEPGDALIALDSGGNLMQWNISSRSLSQTLHIPISTSPLTQVRLSDQGKLIAISDDNGTRVYDTASAAQLVSSPGTCLPLAFAPDEASVLIGSLVGFQERTIVHGPLFEIPNAHPTPITAMTVLPDGRVATAAEDNRVNLWSPTTGKLLESLEWPEPDAKVLVIDGSSEPHYSNKVKVTALAACHTRDCLVSADSINTIRVWDLNTRKAHEPFHTRRPLKDVLVSREETTIFAVSDYEDIERRRLSDGAVIGTLHLDGHSILAAALSWNGDVLAVVTSGRMQLFDSGDFHEILSVDDPRFIETRSIVFSPDGRLIAAAGALGGIDVRSVETGEVAYNLYQGNASVVEFSADGRTLYVLSESCQVQLEDITACVAKRDFVAEWDVAARRERQAIWATTGGEFDRFVLGKESMILSRGSALQGLPLDQNRDSGRFEPSTLAVRLQSVGETLGPHLNTLSLVTRSADQHARVWSQERGQPLLLPESGLGTLTSPDGRWLALCDSRRNVLRVYDAESGAPHIDSAGACGYNVRFVFSPDSRFLASATDKLSLWELDSGRHIFEVPFGSSFNGCAASADSLDFDSASSGRRLGLLEFSPDGRSVQGLAGPGPGKCSVLSFEVPSGRPILIPQTTWSQPRSESLRASGSSRSGTVIMREVFDQAQKRFRLRVWNAKQARETARRDFDPSISLGKLAAVSPDGRFVAYHVEDAVGHWITKLWDTSQTKAEDQIIDAAQTWGEPWIAFSKDGQALLLETGRPSSKSGAVVSGTASFAVPAGTQTAFVPVLASAGRGFENMVQLLDGSEALIKSDQGIELWDTHRGMRLALLAESGLYRVGELWASSRFVAAGGDDGAVLIWSRASGQMLAKLFTFLDGSWAVVGPDGRFDTDNLDDVRGLHWIVPDDPLHPLPLEVFMRDYYQPRLLPLLLSGEPGSAAASLQSLNRVQPQVAIGTITADTGSGDRVTVTVDVNNAQRNTVRDGARTQLNSGVFDLRLFRDGHLVGTAPESGGEVKLDGWGHATVRFPGIRLPASGGAEFSAYAFNVDRIKSATAHAIYRSGTAMPVARRRAYVVSIGVNHYQQGGFRDLSFAVPDALAMSSTLTSALAGSKRYSDVVSVALVSDRDAPADANQATRGSVRAVLDRLSGRVVAGDALRGVPHAEQLQAATPDDLVIVTFSGHGDAAADGAFDLILNDGRLSSTDLSSWLRDLDAGSLALIIDACHSAASVEGEGFKPGPMGSRGLGQLAYDKGMYVLAASQADDVALESPKLRRGLLTFALTGKGIEEGNADFEPQDGRIRLAEWLRYGVREVPQLYAEIRGGAVTDGGRGAELIDTAGLARTLVGRRPEQQPALFDFSRGRPSPVIDQLESSRVAATPGG